MISTFCIPKASTVRKQAYTLLGFDGSNHQKSVHCGRCYVNVPGDQKKKCRRNVQGQREIYMLLLAKFMYTLVDGEHRTPHDGCISNETYFQTRIVHSGSVVAIRSGSVGFVRVVGRIVKSPWRSVPYS